MLCMKRQGGTPTASFITAVFEVSSEDVALWWREGGGSGEEELPALLLCTELPSLQDPALYLDER